MKREEMRVALYGRVSTKDKGQENENQLAQMREFVARQGWTIVTIYTDEVSGAKVDRRAMKQMFTDASRRKFDLLLFWALDRFTREGPRETQHYLERLEGYGVGWRSYTEQYLDSTGIF